MILKKITMVTASASSPAFTINLCDLGKLFNLSLSQFLHLEIREHNTLYLMELEGDYMD